MSAGVVPIDLVEAGLSTGLARSLGRNVDLLGRQRAALREHESFRGLDFEPQIVAFRDSDTLTSFEDRVGTLAQEAFGDLAERFRRFTLPAGIDLGVAVILPEPEAGLSEERLAACGSVLADELSRAAAAELGVRIVGAVELRAGHAALGLFLARFRAEISAGYRGLSLVVVADSMADRGRLLSAGDTGRTLFSAVSPYGLVPGEAAAVLLFADSALTAAAPLARLTGSAIAHEAAVEASGAHTRFDALCEAGMAAWNEARPQPPFSVDSSARIDAWYTDWNNSRYRASELSVCAQRLGAQPDCLREGLEFEHPATRLGDLGAASVGAALALIGETARRRHPGGLAAMVTSGSWSSGLRSAILAAAPAADATPDPIGTEQGQPAAS